MSTKGSQNITRKDCTSKMKIRTTIVSKKFEQLADAAGVGTPTYNYFNPVELVDGTTLPRNVFLFERDKILSIFFKKTDIPLLPFSKNAPTHLMIAMGAHDVKTDEFEIGQPTVIAMGIKPKKGAEGDVVNVPIGSLDDDYASQGIESEDEVVGIEYPPSSGRVGPPSAGNTDNGLTFKINW